MALSDEYNEHFRVCHLPMFEWSGICPEVAVERPVKAPLTGLQQDHDLPGGPSLDHHPPGLLRLVQCMEAPYPRLFPMATEAAALVQFGSQVPDGLKEGTSAAPNGGLPPNIKGREVLVVFDGQLHQLAGSDLDHVAIGYCLPAHEAQRLVPLASALPVASYVMADRVASAQASTDRAWLSNGVRRASSRQATSAAYPYIASADILAVSKIWRKISLAAHMSPSSGSPPVPTARQQPPPIALSPPYDVKVAQCSLGATGWAGMVAPLCRNCLGN